MQLLDYTVLLGYFGIMIGIGVYTSMKIKKQEDFFMGGRSFGKLMQTFAAFGAGTGSSDPVNTGRTTFTGGMSGMWSVMYWLFVTPLYWISGVWYRRMRLLTLGDWYVERYESKAMGAAYGVFGILFMMVYGSMLFSAIGKVAAPIIGASEISLLGSMVPIEYLLVPIIGVVVLAYGIAGGLEAAYYTDLIQGLCIILLSVLLIPFGLSALVEKFGAPGDGMLDGFRLMHEQAPKEFFSVLGSGAGAEFPLHRIIAVVLINAVGIVVQPHFIVTGGGSAKDEWNARVGLVVGNFLKRFCTIGWVLTALIALALFSDHPELVADADKTWGVASRELLGPGLTGLMLACLLAALMSSIDAYMVVGSALVVRNIYAPYINPNATDKQYLSIGRWTGVIVVGGAVIISLTMMDVFKQLQLTWIFPVVFAAPFWIGMFWRRATTTAAWATVAFCALTFFVIPMSAPIFSPGLRTSPDFLATTDRIETTSSRLTSPSDMAKRNAQIKQWDLDAEAAKGDEQALEKLGDRPSEQEVGEPMTVVSVIQPRSVFWKDGLEPIDDAGNLLEGIGLTVVSTEETDNGTVRRYNYAKGIKLRGKGSFQLDFLLYQLAGVKLESLSNAFLATLELPPKILTPFMVMILISLVTRRNSKDALDRYYAKMKTPVDIDPKVDEENLKNAYKNPEKLESKKMFPGTSFEFRKPDRVDIIGLLVCFFVCFAVIGLAALAANIQF